VKREAERVVHLHDASLLVDPGADGARAIGRDAPGMHESRRAVIHRWRPSSNRALSGTVNDDSASTRIVNGVGPSEIGSKLDSVYARPTFGFSPNASARGTIVGNTTGPTVATRCVSAADSSCAITTCKRRVADGSAADGDRRTVGFERQPKSESPRLRDSRTSDVAVAGAPGRQLEVRREVVA
jgi:hypothetical protein